jgi:dipeptidyl aminopeptidase/acylaminoacyl peptidase
MPTARSIAALCALVVAVSTAAPPTAHSAAPDGAIAFASGRGGLFEIWSADDEVDATAQPLVTGPPGSIEVDPAWDPDAGGGLAFARKSADDETFDLFLRPATGSATRLTDEGEGVANDRQPDWSGNDMIAFTRSIRADATSHIYAVPASGGSPVRLTQTAAPGYDGSPSWSPNGARIAFVSDRSGTPQLWTMNADGSAQTQRTFDPCFVSNPDWSGDGLTIVFERQCPSDDADLYRIVVSGGTPTPFVAAAASDHQPAFAPDGSRVLFTRIEADGDKELYGVSWPVPGGVVPIAANDPERADMTADWGQAAGGARAETASTEGGEAGREESTRRAAARPRRSGQSSRRVVKGVRFIRMRKAKSDVYVLKVDPKRIPRIDVSLSNDLLAGHERTRSMARRHHAVAAINGDFGTPSGRPAHTFAEDGDLKQLSFAGGPTFSITADEQQRFLDRPSESVTAIEQDTWPVIRWNLGMPAFTDVAAFTPAGGALEVPPSNSCSARLLPVGGRRWAPNNAGVEVDYAVNEVSCSTSPMGVGGGVVLSGRPGSDGAILIGSLTPGEIVTLAWSIGFAGVLDTVGGSPLLVQAGAVVAKPCGASICQVHPRTAIGVTPVGRILMVVVDGRRNDSRGVTTVRLARLMRSLGATSALNLDGGGSSTMVVRGKKGGLQVVNEPSDGRQRRVSSAVLVIRGPDPGEVVGAPTPKLPATAPPRPARDAAGRRTVLDPASTGGLLEAMAEGTFGSPVDLPPELRRALRTFLSSS